MMLKIFALPVTLFVAAINLFAQPVINSISPVFGSVGSAITISGTGFSSIAAENLIYFGPAKANVSTATSGMLTVTVPDGAVYAPISVTVGGLTAYSLQSFSPTYYCYSNLTGSSFAADGNFLTDNNGPRTQVSGDFDGDGKTDIGTADYTANNVSVFRNTSTPGDINFATGLDLDTPGSPSGIVSGDLDGDGMLDIVTGNNTSNNISAFRNTSTTGSLSFTPAQNFGTGSYAYHPVIRDLDGDGKPDVAVTNYNSATISVLRNTSSVGSISFAAKVDFSTGSNPSGIAVGDLDGDNKPDIVVSNRSAGTVSVFLNISTVGNILFAAKVDFAAGTTSFDVAIADIDGDAKRDLIVTNTGSNNFSVLRNTCTLGNASFAGAVNTTTGNGPYTLVIGDIDGDESMDVLTANSTGNSVSLCLNTSSPDSVSFSPKVDLPTGILTSSVLLVDLDGDRKQDITASNEGTDELLAFRNTMICIVGLEEQEFVNHLTIYPNPSDSRINLALDYELSNGSVRIVDALGAVVYQREFSNNQLGIEVSELSPGTYLVFVYEENNLIGQQRVILF